MENVKIYISNIIDFINQDWEDYEKINAYVELWRKPYFNHFYKCVKFVGILNSTDINHVMNMMNNPETKIQISIDSVLPIENIQKIKQIKMNDMDVSLYYQDNKFPWPYSKRYSYLITMIHKISNDHYIYIEKTIDHNEDSINTDENVLWNYTNTISYEKKDDHILTTMTCKFDLGDTYIPVPLMDHVVKGMSVLYKHWNQLL